MQYILWTYTLEQSEVEIVYKLYSYVIKGFLIRTIYINKSSFFVS